MARVVFIVAGGAKGHRWKKRVVVNVSKRVAVMIRKGVVYRAPRG